MGDHSVAVGRRTWAELVSKSRDAVASGVTRHPFLIVFGVALLARVLVAIVATPMFSGSLVLDDSTFHNMAADSAAGTTAHWDDYTQGLYLRTATFLIPLTMLYKMFGPNMLVGQIFVGLVGAGVVVGVMRLGFTFLPRWAALSVGFALALLPSQVLWSSLVLKDAPVWLVLGLLGLVVALASRLDGRALLLVGAAVLALLSLLAFLREHTLIVASWALVLAAFVGRRDMRLPRVLGAAALGVLVPWLVAGLGPAGLGLVTDPGSLEERRIRNAERASTAFVHTEDSSRSGSPTGSSRDAGQPDRRTGPSDPGGLAADIAHFPRGLTAMLLEPFPLPMTGSLSHRLARAESLLWYPLLLFALIGLVRARHHLSALAFPILMGGGILVTYALAEGNIGTAFRHRGEFVWVVVLLAALGVSQATTWIAQRRSVATASS